MIPRGSRRPAARLRGFLRAQRGLAFIEFALVLPVMLLLVLGGIEVAYYVLAYLRVEQIAQTIADNAGRVRHAVDEADINQLMIGGKLIGAPIDFAANGRIILSDLEQRTTGGVTNNGKTTYKQWIRWQRCAGALNQSSSYGTPIDSKGVAVTDLNSTTNIDHGAVETKSSLTGMGPSSNQIAATAGTAVMVVEIFYTYRPLLGFYQPINQALHAVQAFNIRQRTDFSVYNASKLSGNQRADCRLFNNAIPTS